MSDFNTDISDLRDKIRDEKRGHSEFQIRNFIIGSQPTPYGQYLQCVRELRSRIQAYENMSKTREDLIEKIEESSSEDDIRRLSDLEISIEETKRETYILKAIFEELEEKVDLSNREQLEIDYWDKKFAQELHVHLLMGHPVPVSLAQTVLTLPESSRSRKMLGDYISARVKQLTEHKRPKQELEDESRQGNSDDR